MWFYVASKELLTAVVKILEGPLEVVRDRRGFGKRRGVPDSVFWLRPSDNRFTKQPLPILIELEGTLSNAMDDFAKFASRYMEPEYQYSIQWPVIGDKGREPLWLPVQYEIIGVRANQLTSQRNISERAMQSKFEAWFDRFLDQFETEATVRKFLDITFIEWRVAFTMFGHEFESQVPVIINCDRNIIDDIIERMVLPRLPCIVVVNGKYDKRSTTTTVQDTAVEFPTINPILFTTDMQF